MITEKKAKKLINKSIWSVKNVKTFRFTHDGQPMECSLYKDNKRVAVVYDSANGGGFQYEWLKDVEKEFDNFCKKYHVDCGGFNIVYDSDCVVDVLVNKFQENKELKKLCRNKTVLMLKGRDDVVYYNCKYNKDIKKQVEKKHLNDLVEIVNERFI